MSLRAPGLLLLFLVGIQSIVPQGQSVFRSIPFDTTLAVAATPTLSIDLESGGSLRIIGGTSRTIRVHVTERGRRCADCAVAVTHAGANVQVKTRRGIPNGQLASLDVEIEVPVQCNVDVASIGGGVEIEGIDGTLSGITHSGALSLRRISGAVELQTRRGDVTLRESYVSGALRTLDGRVLFEDVGGSVVGTSARGRVILRRVERADSRN
ncbi:MAG TPA: hypothetical protein VJT85_07555 [Gemmatimonadaceae bacterium]|nr:hypothetical protein [Gemmatimonadaceae bacterium]